MEGKVEAIFDTTFIVQSHAESVSKIVGAIFEGRNRYTQFSDAAVGYWPIPSVPFNEL